MPPPISISFREEWVKAIPMSIRLPPTGVLPCIPQGHPLFSQVCL